MAELKNVLVPEFSILAGDERDGITARLFNNACTNKKAAGINRRLFFFAAAISRQRREY
jgi:hypothetical protein